LGNGRGFIEPPLAVYVVSQLTADENFEKMAELKGYTFQITQNGKVLRTVNVQLIAWDESLHADEMSWFGDHTGALWEAVGKLAELAEVRAGSYEAAMLGLPVSPPVLWLKAGPGGTDLIYEPTVSVKSTATPGTPGKLSTAKDYIARIRSSDTLVRLKGLQDALDKLLATLKQAPPEAKVFYEQSASALTGSRASVARGVAYARTHPEAQQLPPSTDPAPLWHTNIGADSYGYWPGGDRGAEALQTDTVDQATARKSAVTVVTENKDFKDSLTTEIYDFGKAFYIFTGDPGRGVASMGSLGDNRDRILRDASIAGLSVSRSNQGSSGFVVAEL
jgi:hypothetical protein